MKLVSIIASLLLFLSNEVSSQNYHAIPEGNITWQEYQFRTIIPCIYNSTFIYYFDGDTIISSIQYKKLFSEGNITQDCSGGPEPVTSFYPKNYEGAFRQDTILRKVFFWGKNASSESLLYDFNLTTGDSLYFLENNFNDNGWVDIISNPAMIESVDSVLIDGTYRKRMLYLQEYNACGADTSAIIEGLGNTRGFIYPRMYPCSIYKVLECVSLNGNRIFGNADTCYKAGDLGYSSVGNMLTDESSFEVANLADGSVLIRSRVSDYSSAYLTITNLLGQPAKNFELEKNGLIVLRKGEFPSGCYFVTLSDNGQIIANRKVLIW